MVGLDGVIDLGDGSLEVGLGSQLDLLSLVLGDGLLWGIVGLSGGGEHGRVWVQLGHQGLVLERVGLGGSSSLCLLLGWLDGSLDLVGVDDLSNIGLGEDAVLEVEVSSSLGLTGESSEVVVEGLFYEF